MEESDEDKRQLGMRFPKQLDVVAMDREQAVFISRIQGNPHTFGKRNHAIGEPGIIYRIVQLFTVRQTLNDFQCNIVQPAEYLADQYLVAHNHVVAVEDVSCGKVEAK